MKNKMENEYVILFVKSDQFLLDLNHFDFNNRKGYESYIEVRKNMMSIEKEFIFKIKIKTPRYLVINLKRFEIIHKQSNQYFVFKYLNKLDLRIIFYSLKKQEFFTDILSITEGFNFSQTELKFLNKFLNNENKYFLLNTQERTKTYLINIISKLFKILGYSNILRNYDKYLFINLN